LLVLLQWLIRLGGKKEARNPRPPPGDAPDELRQLTGLDGRCELRALLASCACAAAAARPNLTFCLTDPNAGSPALSLWLLRCVAPRCPLDPDRLLRCEVLAGSAAAARAADAASALLCSRALTLITGTTDADRFCSARLLLLLALLCPLLPPLGHCAPRLGASLGQAGKSALLARAERAAAAGYANLLIAG
jgi:hypothetical protein